MCLIAFAVDSHPVYSLILAANRDEYRNRPTEQAGFWSDAPHVLAGRDKQAGGSWIGVTTGGKFAAVTNYRDARHNVIDPHSRGMLVADYLRNNTMTHADMLTHLLKNSSRYDGFNILFGTVADIHYFSSRNCSYGSVKPGIHTLSNHLLDTSWPKSVTARDRLAKNLQNPELTITGLLEDMTDRAHYEDNSLPDTGIGLDRERFLSPVFIDGDTYGTRSTTVILASHDGTITFVEKSYDNPDATLKHFNL